MKNTKDNIDEIKQDLRDHAEKSSQNFDALNVKIDAFMTQVSDFRAGSKLIRGALMIGAGMAGAGLIKIAPFIGIFPK